MIFPIVFVILGGYIAIFTVVFWLPATNRRALTHALIAAVVSSGAAGVCALYAARWFPSKTISALHAPQPAAVGMLHVIASTLLFFIMSFGPNLVGMAMVSMALSRRTHWRRLCQVGGFIPFGIGYGLGVLLASLGPLLPLLLVLRPGDLLDLLTTNTFYATGALAGITAIGSYVFLQRLHGTPATPLAESGS